MRRGKQRSKREALKRQDASKKQENHARDVGKRVWNAAAKAEREMTAQKERHATAVRAAKRAASKDPTKESAVADAERARDGARTAALAAANTAAIPEDSRVDSSGADSPPTCSVVLIASDPGLKTSARRGLALRAEPLNLASTAAASP